jgi:hypothetical protein
MGNNIIQLDALKFTGPRSFFTDLDPNDRTYDEQTVKLKLKLQFLTKEKVVIAYTAPR